MDKQAKKNTNESLFLIVAVTSIIIILDWLYRCRFGGENFEKLYQSVFHFFKPYLLHVKAVHLIMIALIGYVNSKKDIQKKINQPILYFLAGVTTLLFLAGYNSYLWYNVAVFPLLFLVSSYSVIKAIQYIAVKGSEESVLDLVSSAEITDTRFAFNTNKGNLVIPNAEHGIWMEAGPGGGKTVLIDNMLYQAVQKGFAGVVYDFEGNPQETDETNGKEGTILSRTVYTAMKLKTKEDNVRFAFLNFNDLSRTVRCNPYSRKYIDGPLDIIELSNTLMKNLEKSWVSKTDFWASNAINVVTGAHLWLHKHRPDICDIPHLIALILSDFKALLGLLASDRELEVWTLPVISAYKQEAHAQTAGVISTSQLPLTKLYVPEIFWVLSPPEGEDFNLDITDKKNPSFLCLGNNGIKQNAALGPVLALILTICTKNMNRFNRVKGLLAIDEGDTIYLPNIDLIPATIRKKGVITLFAIQTFNQTIDKYGENAAKKLRDNLNNQFLGKTNNEASAERMVKMFGEYKKTEFSHSEGDGGQSQTASLKNEKFLQIPDIALQETGHFTGYISNGKPQRFHAQFENFIMEKMIIPRFSLPINTGNIDEDLKVLDEMVAKNFKKIRADIDEILLPFTETDPLD